MYGSTMKEEHEQHIASIQKKKTKPQACIPYQRATAHPPKWDAERHARCSATGSDPFVPVDEATNKVDERLRWLDQEHVDT